MIRNLLLEKVGPAPRMGMRFRPRFNVLTGDNGLGKTFLLDTVWWALTRSKGTANPIRNFSDAENGQAKIELEALVRREGSASDNPSNSRIVKYTYTNTARFGKWSPPSTQRAFSGLMVYARLDGGISVWDPAKNTGGWSEKPNVATGRKTSAYNFSANEIWDGKKQGQRPICNGLIRDWVSWQQENSDEFRMLCSVLEELSPNEAEQIKVAEPERIAIDDSRKFPAIQMPYGTVPLTIASAGMRRVISIAYALVWAWSEHQNACKMRGIFPSQQFLFLMDEVEAHLHPQWQRIILPSLHRVCSKLTQHSNSTVQFFVTTHAPLVMASLERAFDDEQDSVSVLEAMGPEVALKTLSWSKQGDTVGWLVSDSFGLQQARSKEAERVIEAAEAFMRDDRAALPEGLETQEAIHSELLQTIPGHDPFWPRWIVKVEGPE